MQKFFNEFLKIAPMVIAIVVVDKKLGVSSKIASMIPPAPTA